ncbi:hypothetical protein [Amycolatopsis magusensis]|uniref:hypothetical protein n=1 Tax=Amycolatopsis magusensis TaxID=882444 RepID=UPI003C2E9E5B
MAVTYPPTTRTLPRVLSGLAGLVLTPIALYLVSEGGLRERRMTMELAGPGHDALGLTLLVLGALLLLGVAALAAVSSTGPLLGGLVWGVVPGVLFVVAPIWSFRRLGGFGGDLGLTLWLSVGALLAVGMLLVGTGIGAAIARRRGVAPSAHGTVHGAGSTG